MNFRFVLCTCATPAGVGGNASDAAAPRGDCADTDSEFALRVGDHLRHPHVARGLPPLPPTRNAAEAASLRVRRSSRDRS
jgi:hypothetical protein